MCGSGFKKYLISGQTAIVVLLCIAASALYACMPACFALLYYALLCYDTSFGVSFICKTMPFHLVCFAGRGKVQTLCQVSQNINICSFGYDLCMIRSSFYTKKKECGFIHWIIKTVNLLTYFSSFMLTKHFFTYAVNIYYQNST